MEDRKFRLRTEIFNSGCTEYGFHSGFIFGFFAPLA
jgi:hypothetical protein